eukprot:TRINITY_DN2865_c0_g1_i1.p1 TRINITY_DN2865_c0_g1~~TRINITY_DN2865_c0_g1_i1.p1  ORF type:complete len:108 (+),score=15.31 TRINITY_DN2865_c0_g1_i1:110-433(+)
MHSTLNEEFGRGNLGSDGMERFLKTHSCNAICKYLQLPPVGSRDINMDVGTVPALRSTPFPRRPAPLAEEELTSTTITKLFSSVTPPLRVNESAVYSEVFSCSCSVL